MKRGLIFVLLLILISFSTANQSSNDAVYNYLYNDGQSIVPGFNYSINVNRSYYSESANNWNSGDHGLLRNVIDISHSWLDSLLWSNAGHTMDTLLEMNGNDINNVKDLDVNNNANIDQNLTVGGNSRVQGDVEVVGKLCVGILCNESFSAADPGDAVFEGNVVSNDTIASFPKQFSPGLLSFNNGDNNAPENPIFISATGILDTTTGLFCDTTNSPFSEDTTGRVVITIFTNPTYPNIWFPVNKYINSSCINLNLATIKNEDIPNLAVIVYALAPDPVFAAFDGGSILTSIGDSEDANFRINALNSSGQGKFQINVVANSNSVNAMKITSDQKDFHGLSNIISTISSGEPGTNILMTNSIFNADLLNQTEGEYTGVVFSLLNPGTNITKTAIEISSDYDTLILTTKERQLSSAIYDNTTELIDITSEINNLEITTEIFNEVNGTIYIGNGGNFTKVSFNLFSESSDNIEPEFYYCNDGGIYTLMNVSDSTGGFTSSGDISYINPLDRGVCNTTIEGDAMPNSTEFTYIAIRRKATVVSSAPVISESMILSASSRILLGNDGFIEADTAFGFINDEFQEKGSITHYFEAKNIDGEPLTNLIMQAGKNNSVGIFGNSFFVAPNFWGKDNFSNAEGKVNLTQLTNYITLCSTFGPLFGVVCQFSADTRTEGTLIAAFNAEIWKLLRVHGGARIDTNLDVILSNDNDVDIINGSIYPRQDREEQVGFSTGDNVTVLDANFDNAALTPFEVLTTGGTLDWTAINEPECHSGFCARSIGGTGSPPRIMETNFSTDDIDNLNLTFWLTSSLNGDLFTLDVNNNEGSGDINVYTTTINNIDVFVSTILPASMDNKSIITLRATLIANNPIQDAFYLDDVLIIGNATTDTIVNVTRTDSIIKLGDGTRQVYYNDSTEEITLIAPSVNIEGLRGSYVGGSAPVCVWDNGTLYTNEAGC